MIADLAHNPHAARALAGNLATMGRHVQTCAVFGCMADKDIPGIIAAMQHQVDHWLVASLPGPRGASANRLRVRVEEAGISKDAVTEFASPREAYLFAQRKNGTAERVIVFGSFLTVSAVMAIEQTPLAPAASSTEVVATD